VRRPPLTLTRSCLGSGAKSRRSCADAATRVTAALAPQVGPERVEALQAPKVDKRRKHRMNQPTTITSPSHAPGLPVDERLVPVRAE
jgi:hypothetical protein